MIASPKLKKGKMLRIENALGEPLEEYLRRELNQRQQKDVAASLGVSSATLSYWLLKLGIHQRWQ